jgi:Tfp pilus assembly protein PilF
MKRRCWSGVLLSVLLAVSSASAQKVEDPKVEAAARFDRGLTLFEEGDNAGALAEFRQAYAIFANPVVRYNIGLVFAAMNRPVDAADALRGSSPTRSSRRPSASAQKRRSPSKRRASGGST